MLVVLQVRQICHIALKRDHEFINTVQEGSEETHAKVLLYLKCILLSNLLFDFLLVALTYGWPQFGNLSGQTDASGCSFGQALSNSLFYSERSYCG